MLRLAPLLLLLTVAQAPPQPAVYVGPQTRDGFVDVDQGILDSIADIQKELRAGGRVSVASRREDATITLLVVGRRLAGAAGAVGVTTPGATVGGGSIAGVPQPAYTGPGVTTVVPVNRYAIDTLIRVGTHERPMTSDEGDTWRAAAKRVAKDLIVWIDANRDALAR